MGVGDSVLIVDDEEQIQNVLKQFLGLHSISAISEASGRDAMEALEKTAQVGLILLDLRLPDCNGSELASRIGERTENRIPVLVMSGNPDLEEMRFPECVVGTIRKPFDFTELLEKVSLYCGNAPTRTP